MCANVVSLAVKTVFIPTSAGDTAGNSLGCCGLITG